MGVEDLLGTLDFEAHIDELSIAPGNVQPLTKERWVICLKRLKASAIYIYPSCGFHPNMYQLSCPGRNNLEWKTKL